MLTAGVDIGSLWTKAVALLDGKIVESVVRTTGISPNETAEAAVERALQNADLGNGGKPTVFATGAGRAAASFAAGQPNEVVCAATGSRCVDPKVMGVLDLGAESSLAVRLDTAGAVDEYSVSDKCASGTGIFLDAMAQALGVDVEQMGPLSLQSTQTVDITSTCVVFAESEVVSQVHRQTPKADILRGMHKAIATRIVSLASRVGLKGLASEGSVMAIGGLARNVGIITCLEEMMGARLIVPEHPHLVSALGAAHVAAQERGRQ